MSSGKLSGFSDIAKQAMMQPQESMLEVKNKKHKLYIGIPKEISFQENRVPLTPLSVALLVNNGHDVMLESNAGQAAKFSDKDYSEQGAQIVWSKDEGSFPIALGMHPIVHFRGIDSQKEVGVRVVRSRPINRIQVAARLSRLVGAQCFQRFSQFLLQLGR